MIPVHFPRQPRDAEDLRDMEMNAFDSLPSGYRMLISNASVVPTDIALATRHVLRNFPSINASLWLQQTLNHIREEELQNRIV